MTHSADVSRAEAGQCVALALKRIRRSAVRKGMVLVTKTDTPPRGPCMTMTSNIQNTNSSRCFAAIRQFEGQVLIL